MDKRFVTIGLLTIFVSGGLCGCIESSNIDTVSGDIDKLELVEYNVTTLWKVVSSVDEWGAKTYEYIETVGFRENEPEKSEKAEAYIIRGTVKNNAGEKLNRIRITANFYGNHDVFLFNKTTVLYKLAPSYTKNFTIEISNSYSGYFNRAIVVKFYLLIY